MGWGSTLHPFGSCIFHVMRTAAGMLQKPLVFPRLLLNLALCPGHGEQPKSLNTRTAAGLKLRSFSSIVVTFGWVLSHSSLLQPDSICVH